MPARASTVGKTSTRLTCAVDAHPVQLVDRAGDDERHVERVVVDEIPVRPLAMAPQPLAMIADDDDDRLLIEAGVRSQTSTRPTCWSAKAISPSYRPGSPRLRNSDANGSGGS